MTTRTDTIEAWEKYRAAQQKMKDAAAFAKLPVTQKKIKHRSRTEMSTMITGLAVAVPAVPVEFTMGGPLGETLAVSGMSLIALAFVVGKFWRNTGEGEQFSTSLDAAVAYRKFFDVLADEMQSLGMRVMEINHNKDYIVTDRGNVTVLFRDGVDIPVPLLNGAAIQSSYLSDTYEAKDARGNLIHAPNAVAII